MIIDYQRVIELREYFGMTQEELAKAINMQQGGISRFEKGETKNIPKQYIQFLKNNGISLDWLMGWSSVMFINKSKEIKEFKETDDDTAIVAEKPDNKIESLKKINDINDRIEEIMLFYNIKSPTLSKKIDVNPSTIHNIIKPKTDGTKNKPSYKILLGILTVFEKIDANWLITGKGEMLKNNYYKAKIENNQYIADNIQNKSTKEFILEIEELQNKIKELETDKIYLIKLLNGYVSEQK